MTASAILARDGRAVVVAVDHGLYSWPVRGLERREPVLRAAAEGGADAVIASYGTFRELGDALAGVHRILKLDLTTVAIDAYPVSEYRLAWSVEDAARIGAAAVLTYVQLGGPGELDALVAAARVAARADAAGLAYVCEIMPVESERFPDAYAPAAIAAAARTGAELGAHLVKTSLPTPATSVAEAVTACDVPVIIAGGENLRRP